MEKKASVNISYSDYGHYSELIDQFQDLLVKSKEMAEDAYAPYSNFKVGSSVLLKNGKVVGGSNQENRAFPSGLCAERVALFSASAQNPNEEILAIAVYVDIQDQISPCGSCRQVMLEYEEKQGKPIVLLLMNGKGEVRRFNAASDLLPFGFKFNNFSNS